MQVTAVNGYINNDNAVQNTREKAADEGFEKRLKSAFDKKDEAQLKKACQEFEGIFLKMMYRQMKATVPKSGLLEEDSGMEVFESMLDDELMDQAAKSSRLGLSDMLYGQLSRQLKSTYAVE